MAERKGPMFDTAGSQQIGVAGIQAETLPGGSAEFQSGIRQALPSIERVMDLKTEQFKKELSDQAAKKLTPLAQAADIQAFQLSKGTTLAEADPKALESAAAQLVGGEADSPELQSIMKELEYLGKAQLVESGRSRAGALRIRAEATMKKLISQNPLFEEAIRKGAIDVMGFDPTGATMAENIRQLQAFDAAQGKGPEKDPYLVMMNKKGFTDEQAEALRHTIVETETTRVINESRLESGKITADQTSQLVNSTIANLGMQSYSLVAELDPQDDAGRVKAANTVRGLYQGAIVDLRRRAGNTALSQPVVDRLNSEVAEMEKSQEAMVEYIESGMYQKQLVADTEMKNAHIQNELASNRALLRLRALVGPDKTGDILLHYFAAGSNEKTQQQYFALVPEGRGARGMLGWAEDGYKMNEYLFTGNPAAAPENAQEELAMHTMFKAGLSDAQMKDADYVQMLENLESSASTPDILVNFIDDSGKIQRAVFDNPRLAGEFKQLYITEKQSVDGMIADLKDDMQRLESRGITLSQNDKGMLSVEVKKSKIPSAGSPRVEGERKLREAVVRANNLIQLNRLYGSILNDTNEQQ
jgi:hypothetical protein